MKHLSALVVFLWVTFSITSAHAFKCSSEAALNLQASIQNVYYSSETDDTWHAFSSEEVASEISGEEIRRVLGLGDTFEGETSVFEMEESMAVYTLLEDQIEAYNDPYSYDDEASAIALRKLKDLLTQKYGDNVRLIKFGNGDESFNYFVGDYMITVIDENGCVFGIKAYIVWT